MSESLNIKEVDSLNYLEIIFFRFILIFTPLKYFDTSYVGSWALILLTIGMFTIFIFIESFKEEKEIRSEYIHFDE